MTHLLIFTFSDRRMLINEFFIFQLKLTLIVFFFFTSVDNAKIVCYKCLVSSVIVIVY